MLVNEPEARLIGYVQAVVGQPGFAVLLFRMPEANRLVAQAQAPDGTIRDFTPIEPPTYTEASDDDVRVSKGQPALWCYIVPGEPPCIGSREEVADWLQGRIETIEDPLLRLQAAEFCEDDHAIRDAWRASFVRLKKVSPKSANAWRDVVVLPGRVRDAVASTIAAYGIDDADRDLGGDVAVSVEAGELHISFEARLYEELEQHAGALARISDDTLDVRDAFDLAPDIVIAAHDSFEATPAAPAGPPIILAYGTIAVEMAKQVISPDGKVRVPQFLGKISPSKQSPSTALLIHGQKSDEFDFRTQRDAFTMFPAVTDLTESTVLILFSLSAQDSNISHYACDAARSIPSKGYRKIAVIPHLPDPGLTADEGRYAALLNDLQSSFDAICILSDQSPHLKGGIPFGPARSLQAAANRFRDLMQALEKHYAMLGSTKVDPSGLAMVYLISSVRDSGSLTTTRLAEHMLDRVKDFTLDWNGAQYLHFIDHEIRIVPDNHGLDQIADRERIQDVTITSVSQPRPKLASRQVQLQLGPVKWRATALDTFPDTCRYELQLHEWHVTKGERNTRFRVALGDINMPVECRAYGATANARPLRVRPEWSSEQSIVLTNGTISRSDFVRHVLSGKTPVHFSNIGNLATIVSQRYAYVLRSLDKSVHHRILVETAFSEFFDMKKEGDLLPEPGFVVGQDSFPPTTWHADVEDSEVNLHRDAASVDLVITAGAPETAAFRQTVRMLLTREGWQIATMGVRIGA